MLVDLWLDWRRLETFEDVLLLLLRLTSCWRASEDAEVANLDVVMFLDVFDAS